MEEEDSTVLKKEITVKRVSAFKFEIEVSVGMSKTEVSETVAESNRIQNRISVIRRAPPRIRESPPKRCTCGRKMYEGSVAPAGAILIKDAILYRIIEILLWKVLGEENLSLWGYPSTPTYRLLWKVVHHYSYLQPGACASVHDLHQNHDCKGDINCFMDHVGHFLDLCAPTQEIRDKFGWSRLSKDEILRKIYDEDLLPFLSKSDLSKHGNILNSYKDILRLQRWQQQGFSAISWNGHEHFSRLKSRFSWCPQCSRRLRKSVISY